MTLIELLVAGVISLIAATGMVIVMAQTLGTGSQTIQMARLTQEMRTAMQIMSRELRRANFHTSFMSCYGNSDCRTTPLGIADKIKEITIVDSGNSDCFYFWYDRPNQTMAQSYVAAFRRTIATGTIGKLQMTTILESAPNCNLSANWIDITDPDIIDVQQFNVINADSYTEIINADGETQSVQRIGLNIQAKLVADPVIFGGGSAPDGLVREMQEFITVRNHTTSL